MNGALFFAADLLRELAEGTQLEGFGSVSVASYGNGTAPQGPPRVSAFPAPERLAGRTALVLDTILDTGATADAVMREARARGASEVRFACLLDKASRRTVPVRADYVGFVVPDRFLVGYGLDAAGRLRTLPFVAAMAGGAE
jgi:hypoxanthine phosphoribosyltransferase